MDPGGDFVIKTLQNTDLQKLIQQMKMKGRQKPNST